MIVDEQIRESQLERKKENGELASFGEKYSGQYDQDIYGKDDRGAFWIELSQVVDNYNDVIEDDDEVEDVNRNEYAGMYRALRSVLTHRHPATVNRRRMEEAMAQQNEVEKMRQEGGSLKGVYKLSERENDAQRQLRKYKMSPEVIYSSSHSPAAQRSIPRRRDGSRIQRDHEGEGAGRRGGQGLSANPREAARRRRSPCRTSLLFSLPHPQSQKRDRDSSPTAKPTGETVEPE